MKIYASQETHSWIDSFLGKDLWVLCNVCNWRDTYVKLVSVYPSPWEDLPITMIEYNECPKRLIDVCLKDTALYTSDDLSYVNRYFSADTTIDRGLDWFLNNYSMVTPPDVISTEELLEIIGDVIDS